MTDEASNVGGPLQPGEGGEAIPPTAVATPEGDLIEPDTHPHHVSGALLLSFGTVHPGREGLAVDAFTEASRFLGEMLADAVIDSFKPFFFDGGAVDGVVGFFIIEGRRELLDGLRRRPDFQRMVLRAGASMAGVRVQPLVAGTEAGRLVNLFREVRGELGLL